MCIQTANDIATAALSGGSGKVSSEVVIFFNCVVRISVILSLFDLSIFIP